MGVLSARGTKDEVVSLKRAIHPKYDKFIAKFPKVAFKECMMHHDIENEKPSEGEGGIRYLENSRQFGAWERRHATPADIEKTARELTDEEISGNATTVQKRRDLGMVDSPEWKQWIE
ncbi:hypothetical protein DL765_008152 [Monosporascus sp. GIB2]|nr:hypothetical protein DL765_008152 [Monosporascus sp. GIB2]